MSLVVRRQGITVVVTERGEFDFQAWLQSGSCWRRCMLRRRSAADQGGMRVEPENRMLEIGPSGSMDGVWNRSTVGILGRRPIERSGPGRCPA